MLAESKRLDQEILSLQEKIESLPGGHLVCTANRQYHKWYKSEGNKLSYIKKKDRLLAEQLAIKKYYMALSDDLLREKKAIEGYLYHHISTLSKSMALLDDTSGYKELLNPHFKPISEKLLLWRNAPYQRNTTYPEQLIHKSFSGNTVRSKSEALIDMALYMNKIPYRYECILQLNGIILYPDFTICHPQTGEVFYWEHFGMMDNSTYCKNTFSKLEVYSANDIIPSINLITTYETKDKPLNSELIQKVIQYYFL